MHVGKTNDGREDNQTLQNGQGKATRLVERLTRVDFERTKEILLWHFPPPPNHRAVQEYRDVPYNCPSSRNMYNGYL